MTARQKRNYQSITVQPNRKVSRTKKARDKLRVAQSWSDENTMAHPKQSFGIEEEEVDTAMIAAKQSVYNKSFLNKRLLHT